MRGSRSLEGMVSRRGSRVEKVKKHFLPNRGPKCQVKLGDD